MEAKSDQYEPSEEQENNQAAVASNFPPYDMAHGTRKLLLTALVFSVLLSLAGIGFALYTLVIDSDCLGSGEVFPSQAIPLLCFFYNNLVPVRSITSKALTLLFNITVAMCTESLGYIHSVSLRWALAAEGRLDFNSNLRLFSRARRSVGHGVIANISFFFCLVLCYAGASCAIFEYSMNEYPVLILYPIGVLGASFGLLGLSLLTGIAWLAGDRSNRIKSWNAHPLNTALASCHHNLASRRIGRATLNSSQHRTTNEKAYVLPNRQPSALQTVVVVKHISRFAIAITCLTLGLACIALIVDLRIQPYLMQTSTWDWNFFDDVSKASDSITIDPYYLSSTALGIVLPLLWMFCWQSISTISFHILELAANIRRDEKLWRSAERTCNGKRSKGANIDQNVVSITLSSKSSITLLCLKPLCQWLVSLGLWASADDMVGINPFPLFVLVILLGSMALITVMAARHRPKGPLPSTYGHIQTIVDLVDDWGEGAKGKLWWGDKGSISDSTGLITLRVVGTSGEENGVGEIRLSEVYSPF